MRIGGIGASLAVLATLACGCGHREDSSGDEAPVAVRVRVARLVQASFPDRVVAPGQWKAAAEVAVTTPFPAVVEALGPKVGDRVEKGTVIGSLSTRESRAALRGAEQLAHQATDAASRAEAERGLELARREQVRVPLVAPTSGTVVRRTAEPGAEVAEGAELLAIVHDDGRVFEAHVAAANAAQIRPGESAWVDMDGASPVSAVVQRRLPGVSPEDQSMLVWVTPRSPLPATLIGRFGTARIEVGAPRRGIAIPDSALVEDDLTGELRVARVEANGIAVWTTVRVGRAAEGCHELLSPPLPAGTVVVVDGQRGLPDSVSVVPR